MSRVSRICVLFLLLFVSGESFAVEGRETYRYDAAGRLSRILAPDGTLIRFEYDSLGNLLSVESDREMEPPLIFDVDPSQVRSGASHRIQVEGRNLSGVEILAPTPDFSISDIDSQSERLAFTLFLSDSAPPGRQILRLSNSDGSASFPITLLPPLPILSAGPLPLALPDDGSARYIRIGLSRGALVDRGVTLTAADPQVAELLDTLVTIPVGETQALARIRGLAGGITTLTLESNGLETAAYSVYVTAAYGDVSTKFAELLGVVVGDTDAPASEPALSESSSPLGVVLGPSIGGVSPSVLNLGAASVPVTIQGTGLQGVDSAVLFPGEGMSIEGLDVRPDGTAVTVLVSVDPDAPVAPRRIALAGIARGYPPASSGVDVLDIALPPPQIDSVEPLYVLPGETAVEMLVRGRYLDRPLALAFEPGDGLDVGTDLRSEAGGTRLTARFSVAADAPPGERFVRVSTLGGTSTEAGTAANRLLVVDQVLETVNPVVSPVLGIEFGSEDPILEAERNETAKALGVTLGSVVAGMAPGQGVVGTGIELELRGSGLGDADELVVEPPEGVTVEGVAADPLGDRVRASLLIAVDAAEVWRRVRLYAAGVEIPFAADRAAGFSVTAALPRISAVIPNTLRIGSGEQSLRLRGEYLAGAIEVSAIPPDGLAIDPPSVSQDGTEVHLTIGAASGASTGPRVLTVTTLAGTSAAEARPQNGLTLYSEARASAEPFVAPLVGVTVGEIQAVPLGANSLPAAMLGVQVGPEEEPGQSTLLTSAAVLGVTVGAVIDRIEPPALILGGTYSLRVFGRGLKAVDGAGIFPGVDVSVSSPVPSADGTEIALDLTVSPDARLQPRELRLVSGPVFLPFVDPADALLQLGAGVPYVDSIQPIVAEPGDTLDLIVRGGNFQGATQAVAEPAEGIAFDTEQDVSPDGRELRVRMHVLEDAALGPRVIRIQTPGGTSTNQASPANTFTTY